MLLTRSSFGALKKGGVARRLFYTLAIAAGYNNKAQIARYLEVSHQSVTQYFKKGRVIPFSQDLAVRLLSDSRLNGKKLL